MGRPIKKKLIGNHDGAIKVSYMTGGVTYNGWIVKQKNTHQFVVTDGTHPATCTLKAAAPAANGDMAIQVTDDSNATHYVAKIMNHVAVVNNGGTLATMPWTFTTSLVDGKEQVQSMPALTITAQPAPQTKTAPASATFSVTATATDSPITYQWQSSTDGGTTWGNVNGAAYSGATTATLTINPTDTGKNAFQYRCIVSDADGSVTSTAALLTVS